MLDVGEPALCTDTKEVFIGTPTGNNLIGVSSSTVTSTSGNGYLIELNRWGIIEGLPIKPYVDSDYYTADANIQGINNAIQYAYENNYTEVILPRGKYAVCYPREIKISQDNMTLNLNGSTLKVIYDSDKKSPLDTITTTDYYNFYGNTIVIESFNSHVVNGTLIGCKADRSFLNLSGERMQEHSYGIVFRKSARYGSVKHCSISDYMGDSVNFLNSAVRELAEFNMTTTLNNLDNSTGQLTSSTTTLVSSFINLPTPINYNTILINGFGYARPTNITNKEVGIFYYKQDGTFIRALHNRKIYTAQPIPNDAAKFRFVFYNETDPNKTDMSFGIHLKFGSTPSFNLVEQNEIFNNHRGGIQLGGNHNIIQHNIIRNIGDTFIDGKPGFGDPTRYGINQEDHYGDGCVIRNNFIHSTNHGILVGCYSTQIENNHIYNCTGIAINLYTLLTANIRGNLIYACGSSFGLMTSHFQNSQVFITDNLIFGGGTGLQSGNGYDVYVRGNTWIDPTGITMPDTENFQFKDNNIRYTSYYSGADPVLTINKIEGCTFEAKLTKRRIVVKGYEVASSVFTNVTLKPQTRYQTTIRENVIFLDCKFTNTTIENEITGSKQRKVIISKSKFTDCVVKVSNLNVVGESPMILINDSDIFAKTSNYIFESGINTSSGAGNIQLEQCNIEISNPGFQYLMLNNYTVIQSTSSLELKKCSISYTGSSPLNLIYYIHKGTIGRFISFNNKFNNINLPTQDEKYFGYDPVTQSINEPTSGSFFIGDIMANANPSSGGYLGWVCITSGEANNATWITSTSYALGQQVNTNGNVYQCTVAGTSGTVSPTHTTGTATDGTVTWIYMGKKAVFKQYGQIQA